MSGTDGGEESDAASTWSILGLGGLASLCCLFTAPAAVAAGSGLSGTTTAALGGSIVQILVTALAVGVVGVAIGAWRRVRGPRGAAEDSSSRP